MTDTTIPPEALEAGKDTAFAWLRSFMEDDVRVQNMTDEELGELVSAACIAMLKAWPNAEWGSDDGGGSYAVVLLPLAEPTDD